jgi:hypothetical protein
MVMKAHIPVYNFFFVLWSSSLFSAPVVPGLVQGFSVCDLLGDQIWSDEDDETFDSAEAAHHETVEQELFVVVVVVLLYCVSPYD